MQGGFFRGQPLRAEHGAPLVVIYAEQLPVLLQTVAAHGGEILRPVFSFPGGSRFHFLEPGGNEFAVWSELDPG